MEDYSKYYTEEKKELFASLLETLKETDRVCKKNDIRYFVFAGTLLGAVRHQGFVPWDDDIDLVMLRKDYNKLITIFPKEASQKFSLQTTLTEDGDYYRYPARIRKNDTIYLSVREKNKIIRHKKIDYNCGLFISIFPLDTVPDSFIDSYIQKKISLFRNRILISNSCDNKKITSKAVRKYCKLIGYKNIFKRLTFSYEKYSQKRGQYVQFPPFYKHVLNTSFYTEDFDDIIYLPFEGFTVPCPIGYKRCLSSLYGPDYMTPPPIDKRNHYHGEYINLRKGYKEILSMDYDELISLISNKN